MDYLDPQKKKAHKIRLLVGYALFGVAIGLATLLLVFMANGYYVDRSTGEVIQNGLVFIDSRPGGAEVYINGQKQRGSTDMRLVIPGGQSYDIQVKKAGYRDWNRTLLLEGASLRQLTYARLIPEELETVPALNLRADVSTASQSIDKRWIVLSHVDDPLNLTLIDIEANPLTQQTLQLPKNIVSNPLEGIFEVEEWSDDNRFLLASFTVGNAVDYILLDTRNPDQAQNLNTLFGSKDYEILLQDRKRDKFFVFNKSTQLLYTATLNGGVSTSPFIDKKLLEFTTFGNDWATYISQSGTEGLVEARFKRGDNDMLLKELKTGVEYFVELAKLGDEPVMAVSSPVENRAIVYRDPQKYIADNPEARIPVATTVLRVTEPQDVIISSDTSVILAYGPNNMASHEFEADRSYNFKLTNALDIGQEPRWLDGQHLSFSSGGIQFTMDFDGNNVYDLVSSVVSLGSYFSSSVEEMYSFVPSQTQADGTLTPPSIQLTYLLTEDDR